uniref:Uncharacterized protein n=1 Tax=Desertifilum tharense IPPAS B-1220 TaxID=1781255 RepID=A0ACD5GRM8_9CYAN
MGYCPRYLLRTQHSALLNPPILFSLSTLFPLGTRNSVLSSPHLPIPPPSSPLSTQHFTLSTQKAVSLEAQTDATL